MNWRGAAALAAMLMTGTAALSQTANEQAIDNLPARDDASTEKFLKDAERDRSAAQANSRESRVALEQWAGCLARKNPQEARRVLTMDFTTPTYDRALMMLSQEDKTCMKSRGKLRAGGLLFAGELAEALIEEGEVPLAARLAKAATRTDAPTFSFTDRMAMCLVRSVPDQVAAVFQTARDSEQERTVLGELSGPAQMCAQAVRTTGPTSAAAPKRAPRPVSISPVALRAMLATASLRALGES